MGNCYPVPPFPHVEFMRSKDGEWEPWSQSATPRPPTAADAPFYKTGREGSAQWPTTGVHFYAIRFGERVWDAVNGWRDVSSQGGETK